MFRHGLTVVSTASERGYQQYGVRFLKSFDAFWPKNTRLLFYVSGYSLDLSLNSVRLELHDLQESTWLADFKKRHGSHPAAHGRSPGRIGYRWDAVKFSHKVAAILAADSICTTSHLLWLDADIVTHAMVSEDTWKQWRPDPAWLSWLDRSPKAMHYPECGFLLFNRQHPEHFKALLAMQTFYQFDVIFSLPETHDSFVWKTVVERGKFLVRDLSERGYEYQHVLVHSPLGAYLDHCKGDRRKQIGRTPASELRFKRDEDYWRHK